MRPAISAALLLLTLATLTGHGQTANCNLPNASASLTLALPMRPFAVTATADGCWVFVSGAGGTMKKTGIAVMKRGDGRVELSRTVLLSAPVALGMVLTHDGKLLIVAASDAVFFLDAHLMLSGNANPVLGRISDGAGAASVYANVTQDDKLLFVSDERQRSITVIDLERARGNGYKADAIIGKIPTGNLPIALTVSLDGKWLYSTSEGGLPDWKWPKACKPEGRDPGNSQVTKPEGAVIVVDVARARTDPAQAVVARIPAGCSPVRSALSPDGQRLYVTARNSNAVLAFDAEKLVSDPEHARVGSSPVGQAPVPVAVVDGGRKVIAGNSNRFAAGNKPQTLTVLDTAKMQAGAPAILGTIPTGAFPREMAVSSDGHTLFLTNFGSQSLQIIEVDRLPVSKP